MDSFKVYIRNQEKDWKINMINGQFKMSLINSLNQTKMHGRNKDKKQILIKMLI